MERRKECRMCMAYALDTLDALVSTKGLCISTYWTKAVVSYALGVRQSQLKAHADYIESFEISTQFYDRETVLDAFYVQHYRLKDALDDLQCSGFLKEYGYMLFKTIPQLHHDHSTAARSKVPPEACGSPASIVFKAALGAATFGATLAAARGATRGATPRAAGPPESTDANQARLHDSLKSGPRYRDGREDSDTD
jgi:hypothetical protein